MKSLSPAAYSRSFLEYLRQNPQVDLDRFTQVFMAIIRKNGDWPRRKRILRSCELRWREATGRPLVTIESARKLSPAQRQKVGRQFDSQSADFEEVLRSELLAGVRLIKNDAQQLDWTLARLLRETFARTDR